MTVLQSLPYTDLIVQTPEEFGVRAAPDNSHEFNSPSNPQIPEPQIIDPDDPPWGVFMAVLVFVASFLVLALTSALALFPYAARRGITLTNPDYQHLLTEFALNDPTAVFLQVCSTFPAHLITLLIVWAVVTKFGRRPFWKTLGWDWGKHFGLWTSLGLAVGLFLLSSAVAHFLGGEKLTPLEVVINSSAATRYAIAALATLTAPLVEELVFRGVVYSALQRFIARIASLISGSTSDLVLSERARLIGKIGAVLLVTLVFASLHVPQYKTNYGVIAAISLLSLSLTSIRAVSGKLLPCYIVHLVFNGIQSVIIVWQGHTPIAPERAAMVLLPLLRSFNSLI